jgi:hypothetical protein
MFWEGRGRGERGKGKRGRIEDEEGPVGRGLLPVVGLSDAGCSNGLLLDIMMGAYFWLNGEGRWMIPGEWRFGGC